MSFLLPARYPEIRAAQRGSALGTTVNVLLGVTPQGLDLEDLRRHILETEGVAGCHVWTITSAINVISAHAVLQHGTEGPDVLCRLRGCLAHRFDAEHPAFELGSGM
jgi:cobalt-zinc-cadmium efflux system protein